MIRATPESLQGCYELTLSKWAPDLHLGEDAEFITPPRRIFLSAERGLTGREARGFLLRPVPGEQPSIHRASYWNPKKDDTIELVWTTGFSGLTAELHRKGDRLVGEAHTFWDFPRRKQKSKVVAQKIECGK